ncbi:hypothetical protein DS843_22605 [Roseomonas genomospecies 6]|uniref:Uncharacterized protein n=1 Tax=Roseomonas genomospecies 6 TaxID=214106 RepID=A0A9W7NFP9_9PROT|nr:hypothetical protein DS843_22605 [Roseomonas genomospecies 6]
MKPSAPALSTHEKPDTPGLYPHSVTISPFWKSVIVPQVTCPPRPSMKNVSMPAPPVRKFEPVPPSSTSLPAPASIASLPASRLMKSLRLEPITASFAAEPSHCVSSVVTGPE